MTEELKVNTPADNEQHQPLIQTNASQIQTAGKDSTIKTNKNEAQYECLLPIPEDDEDYESECSGDKCLGFIKGYIGVHLTGSWHLLQFVFSLLLFQYLPGLAIYFWVLSIIPMLVWYASICIDTVKMRTIFYYAYLSCVIASCMWGTIGPWILRQGFWGNNCLEFVIDGDSGKIGEVDRCSIWHFTMFFQTLLRLPFQINIICMISTMIDEKLESDKITAKRKHEKPSDANQGTDQEHLIA